MIRSCRSPVRLRAILVFCAFFAVAFAQQPQSWTSHDKLALTYFFYWWDAITHAGYDFPGNFVTLHPPDSYLSTYSYTEVPFFQRELSDMAAAGVDVALPVFWGDPASVSVWSVPGLQLMVQAEQAMAKAGQAAPRIGMFDDITSLQVINGGIKPDLTTIAGKKLFYEEIHNFYSIVPKQFWAMIDGRPIIVLYVSSFVSAYDQSTFDYVSEQFQQEFGTTPYIIREDSWRGVMTDAAYAWGASTLGPITLGDVTSVGPGENTLAVTALEGDRVADRYCGNRFQREWDQVRSRGTRLVMVETWNELFEGTGISATKEYGRRYIDQTASNVTRWKAANAPPRTIWTSLGPHEYDSGLWALNGGDGTFLTTSIGGHAAAYTDHSSSPFPSHYIYLVVNNQFLPSQPSGVWVTVEYLDSGGPPWRLEYDGASNPYTMTVAVTPQNTGTWTQQTFHLPDDIFQSRENGGADLRIDDSNTQGVAHYFNRVWITQSAPSGQPPEMPFVSDITVQAGNTLDIPFSVLDASGNPLPVSLVSAPGFASLQGSAAAQTIHVAPSLSDAVCSDVIGPGVTSTPSFLVAAVGNDPNSQVRTGATTFQVSLTLNPSFMNTGIVNAASFASGGLVPGSIATLFGSSITAATGVNLAPSLPLATQLMDAEVLVNGTGTPIFAVDDVNGQQQINFQVPWELAGQKSASIQVVNNGFKSAEVNVPVIAAQPGIFAYNASGGTFGAILHANYQLVDSGHPAVAGETVLIYCTGLGTVSSAPADGGAGNGESTSAIPVVTVGGVSATVSFSGLAPGFVGLNQVNVQIPTAAKSGNQKVVITCNGVSSNSVLLPIQ